MKTIEFSFGLLFSILFLASCETTTLGYRKTAGGTYSTQTLKNVNIYGNVSFGSQKESGTNDQTGTASGLTARASVDGNKVDPEATTKAIKEIKQIDIPSIQDNGLGNDLELKLGQ